VSPPGQVGNGLPDRAFWLARLLPLLVLVASGLWMLRLRQGFLVDDAYITFRYSQNLALGHGLVWNPGIRVEGYTNLLWVLLLAPFSRLGVDLTAPALALSLGCSVGSLELLYRVSKRLAPDRSTLAAITPSLLLASIPSFAHAATSGMEGPAFSLFVLFALDRLVLGRSEPRRRLEAAVALSLACLTRPEGVLVSAVLLLVEARALEGPWPGRARALAPPALSVAALTAAHVAARMVYYGHPLPNTFYAKVILGSPTVLRGVAHLVGFLFAGGWLCLPGALLLKRPTPLRPWLVQGYSLLAVYSAYLIMVGGDHPVWYRFYVPLLPVPMLALGELIALRADAARRGGAVSGLTEAQPTAARWLGALAGSSAVFLLSVPFAEPVASILARVDDPLRRAVLETDRFFHEQPRRGAFVAAAAVGHFGYRNPSLFILDMWGLNDEHIAHLSLPAEVKFGHDKADAAYVASRKPDYQVLFPSGLSLAVPGYELCSPGRFAPLLVYRREAPLDEAELHLGLPPGRTRRLGPLPPCNDAR
jgi:arabinofuranosyltransferase